MRAVDVTQMMCSPQRVLWISPSQIHLLITKGALHLSNSKLALNLAAGNVNYMHVKYENVRPQNEGMKYPSH